MTAKTSNACDQTPTICRRTQKRCEACSCCMCSQGSTADAKWNANRRDALALLELIAGCIENLPREQVARPTWGHVGSAAHVREKLLQLSVVFALGPDGDEQAARRRIEEALCADDEGVGTALIEAL